MFAIPHNTIINPPNVFIDMRLGLYSLQVLMAHNVRPLCVHEPTEYAAAHGEA